MRKKSTATLIATMSALALVLSVAGPAAAIESASGSRTCASGRTLGTNSYTGGGSMRHENVGVNKYWVNTGYVTRYYNRGATGGAWVVESVTAVSSASASCDL